MKLDQIKKAFSKELDDVEVEINAILTVGVPSKIQEISRYLLQEKGKRLRPLFLITVNSLN